MKTNRKTNTQSGNLILALLALIALLAIVCIGCKVINKLLQHPFDPNHGQQTNEVDNAWSGRIAEIKAVTDTVTVAVDGNTITVPTEALLWQWHYEVQTSTNLSDWTPLDQDWETTLDQVRTNHAEPCRFYRRVVWW